MCTKLNALWHWVNSDDFIWFHESFLIMISEVTTYWCIGKDFQNWSMIISDRKVTYKVLNTRHQQKSQTLQTQVQRGDLMESYCLGNGWVPMRDTVWKGNKCALCFWIIVETLCFSLWVASIFFILYLLVYLPSALFANT